MYLELQSKTEEELRGLAKKLKLDPNIKKGKLADEIEKAAIYRQQELEATATAKLKAEAAKKMGIDSKKVHPSPETVAIEGGIDPITKKEVPPSKKVYAIFHNQEQQGVDVTFNKGEKYRFHLWDGKVHILPEWLISNLRKTAVTPVYENKPHPVTGLSQSTQTGTQQRFVFEVIPGDVPRNSKFGVVLDDAVLEKLTV